MFLEDTSNMKYFVYLSDSKLRMLYSQIEESEAKRKLEWKLNFKFLSTSRSTEKSSALSKHRQLEAVIKALDEQGQIGTIEEPADYFRGTCSMRWGMFNDVQKPENESPLVYFGAYPPNCILGLGGSAKHVQGFEGSSSTTSRSATPYIVHHLLQGLEIPSEGWNSSPNYDGDEGQTFEAIALATSQLRGPLERFEFVAKTLLKGTTRHSIVTNGERRNCLLGTPLYVAYAGNQKAPDPWKAPWLPTDLVE